MKSIKEYAEEMLKYKNAPDKLVELKLVLSANLVTLLETEYKPVKLQKADFWNMKENYCDVAENGQITVLKKREKALSDTMVDSLWKITTGGSKEIRLDITTRNYKTLIEAITTRVTWEQSQARLER